MPEFLCDIKEETGPATEIENVTSPAAIERKILRPFDVAFNPKFRVAKTMHLFYSARIFAAELFPGRIGFQFPLQAACADGMKRAMEMFAHAADDLRVEKFPQLMREIHKARVVNDRRIVWSDAQKRGAPNQKIDTVLPTVTSSFTRAASQFAVRIQPWLAARPIVSG